MHGAGVRRCLTAVGFLFAGTLGGQNPPRDTLAPHRVDGRVLRGTAAGERGVPSQRVVLHRVATDSAGPLDSTRTGPDGRFRFSYRARDDDAMYIASTSFSGVTYFTAPLRGSVVSGADAEIVVFDTSSRPISLTVRGRHLVVETPSVAGARRAIEVFEIANDTSVTRVAGAGGAATWSIDLPIGAVSPEVRQGDVPAEAVRFSNGVASVYAPFSPGLKQLVLAYELPRAAFPLTIPMRVGANVLEILLEEEGATVLGDRLQRKDPVTLEGRTYRRFLGQDVPAGADVRLIAPPPSAPAPLPPVVIVLVAAVFLALGVATGRRRAGLPGVLESRASGR